MGEIYGLDGNISPRPWYDKSGERRMRKVSLSPTERLILESHGEHIDGPGR
jgi:hypothetical protein